jgi:hypothetical protein
MNRVDFEEAAADFSRPPLFYMPLKRRFANRRQS